MRRIRKAQKRALDLLQEHGMLAPNVDIRALAKLYADLKEVALPDDVSGAVVPVENNSWTIVVNSEHPEPRQRFTIAHELGHILIHQYTSPHADMSFKMRNAQSSKGNVRDEIEANQFAAELLMPSPLILGAIADKGLDYVKDMPDGEFDDLVAELALEYNVSRQAMGIRLGSLLA